MQRIVARSAYASTMFVQFLGSIINPKSQNRPSSCPVECDLCNRPVRGRTMIFHCPTERTATHPFGFDLCCRCATDAADANSAGTEHQQRSFGVALRDFLLGRGSGPGSAVTPASRQWGPTSVLGGGGGGAVGGGGAAGVYGVYGAGYGPDEDRSSASSDLSSGSLHMASSSNASSVASGVVHGEGENPTSQAMANLLNNSQESGARMGGGVAGANSYGATGGGGSSARMNGMNPHDPQTTLSAPLLPCMPNTNQGGYFSRLLDAVKGRVSTVVGTLFTSERRADAGGVGTTLGGGSHRQHDSYSPHNAHNALDHSHNTSISRVPLTSDYAMMESRSPAMMENRRRSPVASSDRGSSRDVVGEHQEVVRRGGGATGGGPSLAAPAGAGGVSFDQLD